MRLDTVSRVQMLRGAWHLAARQRKRGICMWSFVGSVCSVCSGSAIAICREIGWDPNGRADKLPRHINKGPESAHKAKQAEDVASLKQLCRDVYELLLELTAPDCAYDDPEAVQQGIRDRMKAEGVM